MLPALAHAIHTSFSSSGLTCIKILREFDKAGSAISVDKLSVSQHCEIEPFYYVDHSMLNHYNATWSWTFQGGTPSTGNSWNEEVTYSTPGTYLTILTVTDGNGQSDTDSIYVTVEPYVASPVLNEDFEGAFPPFNWEIFNADGDLTWEKSTAAGGFGASSSSMVYRGYDYYPGGAEDDSRISLDLTAVTEAEISFDVAYARYASNYSDSLEVLVSTDCGNNWTSLYFKGGSDLATAPDLGSFFIPSSSEWRRDTIDLASYDGVADLWVAFRGHTGWGNNIYLDNINLGGVNHAGINEFVSNTYQVYPNLLNCSTTLHLETGSDESVQLEIYSVSGKSVYRKSLSGSNFYTVDLPSLQSGTFQYVVRGSRQIKTGKLVVIN